MTEKEAYEAFWAIVLWSYDLWDLGRLQRQAEKLAALYA